MIEYSGHTYERSVTQRPERAPQSSELAEISMEVLIWLADQPDRLGRFIDLSGIRADEIRSQVEKPSFQQGLINFIMMHEPDLIEFAAARDISIERISRCHAPDVSAEHSMSA